MKKIAFVRVGSDKAGTTTFIKFLQDHNSSLEKRGLVSPLPGNCVALFDHIVKSKALDAIDYFDGSSRGGNIRDLNALRAFLQNYDGYRNSDLVFITETVWGRLPKNEMDETGRAQITKLFRSLQAILSGHQVKIILHLRRIDGYIDSAYNQRVKGGYKEPITSFLKHPRIKAERQVFIFDILEEVFGRENIILRPFERGRLKGGDLITDFLEIVGLSDFNSGNVIVKNESLHRALIEVMLKVNAERGKILENSVLIEISDYIRNHTNILDVKGFLSLEDRRQLLHDFRPFYERLAEEYLNVGEMFADPMPQHEFELNPEDEAMIRTLVSSAETKTELQRRNKNDAAAMVSFSSQARD
jgi:hypothetical protein